MNLLIRICAFGVFAFLLSCSSKESVEVQLFTLVSSDSSNLLFNNDIIENDSVNVIDYEYTYNGGGVGVLDINNDGLQDLFFGGNQVDGKLYLNKGDLRFEDVTEQSGISNNSWVTGVTIVDINQDGWDDIYLSCSGSKSAMLRANKLYINQQDNTFKESGLEYGIADAGWTSHSVFFDFDLDGDLDLYVLNHANDFEKDNIRIVKMNDGSGQSNDRFYRKTENGYVDATIEAGILFDGYGLGIAVNDFNNDNWPDIYVSNDYYFDDLLYINNQDGTFSERCAEYMKHTSNFGMGSDMADINNDGLNDLMVLDMLPSSNYSRKKLVGPLELDLFNLTLDMGYDKQFMRNTLQLNNGEGDFSEIGRFAKVFGTDWSWGPLIADFDNDGMQDVYVTNGFKRNLTDRDFILYKVTQERKHGLAAKDKVLDLFNGLDGDKTSNFGFRNNGDLTFTDVSSSWGLERPSYSNGAVYADLDNDGDLEIVTNNIGDPAFLYKNWAVEFNTGNYLKVQFEDADASVLGTKLSLYRGDTTIVRYVYRQRGFQSSVGEDIHFGLGSTSKIDSLIVDYPGGQSCIYRAIKSNQTLSVSITSCISYEKNSMTKTSLFQLANTDLGIDFRAEEIDIPEFKREPLLPHKYSNNGPGIAVGDVNGDGVDDVYIAGSSKKPGEFFISSSNGYMNSILDSAYYFFEEMGALLFDSDGDSDLDLYIVSGGTDVVGEHDYYKDRLYRNDGTGQFTLCKNCLPEINVSGGTVEAADMDNDGDLDLFVGARHTPGRFPVPPRSYLLRNNKGIFDIITESPSNERIGMVTDALFSDYDDDGWVDLIVVGEWMRVKIFQNVNGNFTEISKSGINEYSGWWNSITGADFDNDGDTDYVLGNLGENNPYNASIETPVKVYTKDFDNNGKIDPVMSFHIDGKEHPMASRDLLIDQMAFIHKKYNKYEDYANATMSDLFTERQLEDTYIISANYFSNTVMVNEGNGKFSFKDLPVKAQLAPIYGVQVLDINEDDYLDIVAIGNFSYSEITFGSYDAGNGLVLFGNGDNTFTNCPSSESGFIVSGDGRSFASMVFGDELYLLASQSEEELLIYRSPSNFKKFKNSKSFNLEFKNGSIRKVERYLGDTYLSNSSVTYSVPKSINIK